MQIYMAMRIHELVVSDVSFLLQNLNGQDVRILRLSSPVEMVNWLIQRMLLC